MKKITFSQGWASIVLVALVLVGALTMLVTVQSLKKDVADLQDDYEISHEETNCILYQFALHRQDNQSFHDRLAAQHSQLGDLGDPPARLPVPEIPTGLQHACDDFLRDQRKE